MVRLQKTKFGSFLYGCSLKVRGSREYLPGTITAKVSSTEKGGNPAGLSGTRLPARALSVLQGGQLIILERKGERENLEVFLL